MHSLEILLAAVAVGTAPPPTPSPPAATAAPPPATATAADPLPLKGARLGLSLQDWRALSWPGGDNRGHADCTPPTRAAPLSKAATGAPAPAVLVCRHIHRYGDYSFTDSLPLAGKYRARDPAFVFVDGRLAEVRFHAAVDAFSLVTSRLDKAYGRPVSIERSTWRRGKAPAAPRVRETWRTDAGSVVLTDPSSDPNALAVEFRAARAAARRPS